MCSQRILDFKVLPLKISRAAAGYHELFLKEHSVRHYEEDKPTGRTLFILNVPHYITHPEFKNLFSENGKVSSVKFENYLSNAKRDTLPSDVNNGFKIAYVVFEERKSLLKALELSSLTYTDNSGNGLQKWIKGYNSLICNHTDLNNKIHEYISNYDKEETRTKLEETEKVDNEGWTIVTKKGRNPGLALKESVSAKVNEKEKGKWKKKQLSNFYSFQIRESKMKHIATLREKFDEAKKKVSAMKQLRTFKPY